MVGGDPYKAWLEGTREIYRMQKVRMKAQTDVTIVSAGGYPNTNLYQGTKCYTAAEIAAKKGGIIITMIEAEDVQEPPAYLGSFKYKNLTEMEEGLRACFTIPLRRLRKPYHSHDTHRLHRYQARELRHPPRKNPPDPGCHRGRSMGTRKKQLAEEGKDYISVISQGSAIVPYVEE